MPIPRPLVTQLTTRERTGSVHSFFTNRSKIRKRAASHAAINLTELTVYNNEAVLIQGRQRLYDDMHLIAPLAQAYQFTASDIKTILFVLTCATSAVPLYMIGSAAQVKMVDIFGREVNLYVLGAAYANFLQNILYAWSFARAARNFENENKQLIGWSIFWGVTTALVPTVAMFKLGLRRKYTLAETTALTLMTFVSTAPLSFFGIYEAAKRWLFQHADNPRVRLFLIEQLRLQTLQNRNPREHNVLQVVNNQFINDLCWDLGVAVAISQVLSLYPWFCDTEVTLASISPEAFAWLVSISFFNLPNILIASIFSGFDTGRIMMGGCYQAARYLTGADTYYSTPKETMVTVSLLVITMISAYFCLYSSATSLDFTVTECPSLGLLDTPIQANVNWGTIWGNFVLTMLSIESILRVSSQLSNMRDWIYNEATEKVERIADTYFPGTRELWEKPVEEPKATTPNYFEKGMRYLTFKPSTASIELIDNEQTPLVQAKDAVVEVIGDEEKEAPDYQSTASTNSSGLAMRC